LKILRQCFLDSKILRPELVTPDFQAMFPQTQGGIYQSELLYKMNRDGCTPEIFHKRCDNKGATIMFIEANNGYVFGAFNPTSWLNEFSYSETEDAFLFSLCEPTR
jgi:TLD